MIYQPFSLPRAIHFNFESNHYNSASDFVCASQCSQQDVIPIPFSTRTTSEAPSSRDHCSINSIKLKVHRSSTQISTLLNQVYHEVSVGHLSIDFALEKPTAKYTWTPIVGSCLTHLSSAFLMLYGKIIATIFHFLLCDLLYEALNKYHLKRPHFPYIHMFSCIPAKLCFLFGYWLKYSACFHQPDFQRSQMHCREMGFSYMRLLLSSQSHLIPCMNAAELGHEFQYVKSHF